MPTAAVRALLHAAARPAAETDADLLARFAAHRDEAAFAELVRRHGPLVRGVTRRMAGHPDAADDAFQAAFLLLARKASAGGWGPTVGPWLYRVACRVAGKARDRAARRPAVPLGGDVPAPPSDPAAGLAWAEVRDALDAALAALPARLRDPLVLCYLEGLTRDEAAAALGCSPVVLKGRVARGRDRLRRALAARGLSLPAALAGALVAGDGVSAGAATTLARAAAAYRATGAAPRAVRPLLPVSAGGWVPAAGLAGLLLACGAVGLGAAGPAQDPSGPAAAPPPPAAATPADGAADLLPGGAAVRLGPADLRHPGYLTALWFSPDGRELTSHGHGMIRRWDARTGRPVRSPVQDVTTVDAWFNPETFPTANGSTLLEIHAGSAPRGGMFLRRNDLVAGGHEDLVPISNPRSSASRLAPTYALSPDGTLFARDDDGSVTLWDLQARKPRFTVDPVGRATTVLFTPDGRHLLTAGGGGRLIRFWDTRTGKEVQTINRTGGRLPQSSLARVVVSPDGRRVVAMDNHHLVGYGTELTVWDLDRPEQPRVIAVREAFGIDVLVFGPGGTLYSVTNPDDGVQSVVSKWDPTTGDRLVRWAGPRPSWRGHPTMAVSPDESVIAIGTYSGVIGLYDAKTGKEIATGGGPTAGLVGVGFDPAGREVRTVGEDASVAVWDARTGGAKFHRGPPPGDHPRRFAGAVVSPDGRWVLTNDGQASGWKATLWDAADGRRKFTWEVDGPVRELLPVPGEKLVVCLLGVVGGDRVHARDTATGTAFPEIPQAFDPSRTRYTVTPDGKSLVAWDQNSVFGYDLRTGRERFGWELTDRDETGREAPKDELLRDTVRAVAASPDGKTLAVAVGGPAYFDVSKRTDRLALVDVETGNVIRRTPTPETTPGWLVFSPDGRRLAGPRCVWEVETLKEVRRFPARPPVTAAVFSPDGRRVAIGHANGTAVVWPVGAE